MSDEKLAAMIQGHCAELKEHGCACGVGEADDDSFMEILERLGLVRKSYVLTRKGGVCAGGVAESIVKKAREMMEVTDG